MTIVLVRCRVEATTHFSKSHVQRGHYPSLTKCVAQGNTSIELSVQSELLNNIFMNTDVSLSNSFIQTAFTVVFFCALHEFVRMKFRKQTHIQDDTTDGEMPLIPLHAKGISIVSTYNYS